MSDGGDIVDIVLYSTGCPKCRVLEAALTKKKIAFEKCDDVDKMVSLGFIEAPILQVGDRILLYKDAMKYVMEEI